MRRVSSRLIRVVYRKSSRIRVVITASKPFVWTATVDEILCKVNHCKEALGTQHQNPAGAPTPWALLNVTPDSFSGDRVMDATEAVLSPIDCLHRSPQGNQQQAL